MARDAQDNDAHELGNFLRRGFTLALTVPSLAASFRERPLTIEVSPVLALFANSLRCNGASAAEGKPAVIGATALRARMTQLCQGTGRVVECGCPAHSQHLVDHLGQHVQE